LVNLDSCYRLLDLAPGATEGQVRQARKVLSRVWHPDRFAKDPDVRRIAQEKMKEINAAFETIRKAGFAASPDGASKKAESPNPASSPADSYFLSGVKAAGEVERLLASRNLEASGKWREDLEWALLFKILFFRLTTDRDPTNVRAWEGQVEGYFQQNAALGRDLDHVKVAKATCQILRLDPRHQRAWSWLAGVPALFVGKRSEGHCPDFFPEIWRGDEVVELCQTVIRQHPTTPEAWYVLGRCYEYLDRGRYFHCVGRAPGADGPGDRTHAAQKMYREALRFKADYLEAWYVLGKAAGFLQDWQTLEEAVDALHDEPCRADELRRLLPKGKRLRSFLVGRW
jgi:tetratricopeptide (TPR) repeat protein